MAGNKPFSPEKAPSFRKPYLIVMFGDYEDAETLNRALERLPREMKRRGFLETVQYTGD
jgi:hypothetical protein